MMIHISNPYLDEPEEPISIQGITMRPFIKILCQYQLNVENTMVEQYQYPLSISVITQVEPQIFKVRFLCFRCSFETDISLITLEEPQRKYEEHWIWSLCL